ncbi:MAG TPA: glycosyltransferase family 39 protein, partial [Verrucomicrobiae bacterium]|nr:glycosyltransferase family 39 protein [Verrucomicrobiae bacterium]
MLLATLAISATATIGAMRHTSSTFDEAITIAAGTRGFATGRFDIVNDHPPLMEYLYGLPVYLTHPSFPPEAADGTPPDRYAYTAAFFARSGNDPEYMAVLARLIAVICAALLGLAVFLETHRVFGPHAALFAVILCAFLPDVLAHGGVAYNDLPLAFCCFCTLFAMDDVVREPSAGRAARAGVWVAISMGVKFSAVTLAPAAALLLGAEALARPGDRRWRKQVLRAVAIGELGAYLVAVAIYRGDYSLAEMVRGLGLTLKHATAGHDAA